MSILFALMAALSAPAVELSEALLVTSDATTDLRMVEHSSNQFTLTLKLNSEGIDFLNSYVGHNKAGMDIVFASIGLTSLATTEGATPVEHFYGVGMGYSSNGPNITSGGFYNVKEVTASESAAGKYNGGGNHLFDTAKYNENLTGVAITIVGLNSGSKPAICATMTHADGSTEAINSLFYTGGLVTTDPVQEWTTLTLNTQYIDRAWLFDGMQVTNQATAQVLNEKAIAAPEPATATLSLLALAGLAARRRR